MVGFCICCFDPIRVPGHILNQHLRTKVAEVDLNNVTYCNKSHRKRSFNSDQITSAR